MRLKERQSLKTSLEEREKQADELMRKARMSNGARPVAMTPTQIAASKLAAIRRRNRTLTEKANDALRERVAALEKKSP